MEEKGSENETRREWVLASSYSGADAASERVRREPEVYFRVPHRFRKLYSLYEPERLQPTHRWCGSLLWAHAQIEICAAFSLSLSLFSHYVDLSHPTIYKHQPVKDEIVKVIMKFLNACQFNNLILLRLMENYVARNLINIFFFFFFICAISRTKSLSKSSSNLLFSIL